MIQFHQFEKYYEGRLIIAAPALSLNQSFYWLKGGNGSGKTTLLKSMAGMIPFLGRICLDELELRRDRTRYRQAVNYAAAEPVYPEFLTGTDLLAFYRETKNGTESQLAELTDRMGIGDFMHHKIGTYSSGMIKKLSLVLGFIGQPRLILLDEPLITLDAASVAALLGILEDQRRAGITLLLTSHQEVPPVLSADPELLYIHDHQLLQA